MARRDVELVASLIGLGLWRVEPEVAARWPFERVAELLAVRVAERGPVEGRDGVRALIADVAEGIFAAEGLDVPPLPQPNPPQRVQEGIGRAEKQRKRRRGRRH